ncbi:unnamed protein product [Amoebophrya sp. A25]|nr:unnamed protein product [Amoebophrya sp. A25]|eukprot:GSA25T00018449001.1
MGCCSAKNEGVSPEAFSTQVEPFTADSSEESFTEIHDPHRNKTTGLQKGNGASSSSTNATADGARGSSSTGADSEAVDADTLLQVKRYGADTNNEGDVIDVLYSTEEEVVDAGTLPKLKQANKAGKSSIVTGGGGMSMGGGKTGEGGDLAFAPISSNNFLQ